MKPSRRAAALIVAVSVSMRVVGVLLVSAVTMVPVAISQLWRVPSGPR